MTYLNQLIITDLGWNLKSSFKFHLHVDAISSKAPKMLGFVTRSTKEFNNANAIIYIYKALTISLLFPSNVRTLDSLSLFKSRLRTIVMRLYKFFFLLCIFIILFAVWTAHPPLFYYVFTTLVKG